MIPQRLADAIIRRAQRTPYFHLYHGDGSLYMGRYWLRPYSENRLNWAARVHHIATADYDRVLHDHPWNFVSIVLRVGYTEVRPVGIEPIWRANGEEVTYTVDRRVGSFAYRRATDRHRIVAVLPDTYTLFITGPKRQWWGFYTPFGKMHWREYDSVHNAEPIHEVRA